MKYDELGNRMKSNYETRTRSYLPRRSYVIIRIDGRSFSNYTCKLEKPFDDGFVSDMNSTAMHLCKSIQGTKLAYVQSDEISILVTDFDTLTTDAWFGYEVEKVCSISASIATEHFNKIRLCRAINEKLNTFKAIESVRNLVESSKGANFDSRAFTIPAKTEVINYFIWRQQDAVRNSISSVTRSLYSHRELENINTSQMQEMIHQKGQNWNDYDAGVKRGRIVMKGEDGWFVQGAPQFTKTPNFLRDYIINND